MQQTRVNNGHAKAVAYFPDILKDGQEKLSELNDFAADFIRKRPAAALLGAVCLGFVIARFVSRR
jgi:hypothetical protein